MDSQVLKTLFTYDSGLFQGDMAYRIGGAKLYIEDGKVFKRLDLMGEFYNVDVPKNQQEYARGYVQGFEAARRELLKKSL